MLLSIPINTFIKYRIIQKENKVTNIIRGILSLLYAQLGKEFESPIKKKLLENNLVIVNYY